MSACRASAIVNALSFCCSVCGCVLSQATLLRPSRSSLTNSLCQALPQAAPCNYSPMPHAGEMGVRYTLCVELRKTTTVGPLFVNQIQGQNKMLSGTSWVLVIIIENCHAKEHFYWFPLFFFFYHPGISPDLWVCFCFWALLSFEEYKEWKLFLCSQTLQAVHTASRATVGFFIYRTCYKRA